MRITIPPFGVGDLWGFLLSDISTNFSIGKRLKDFLADCGNYLLGDSIRISADVATCTASTSYIIRKKITLTLLKPTTATLRVVFTLWRINDVQAAYGQIYKNGVAFGTERVRAAAGKETFSEDLEFSDGDTIELWAYIDGAGDNACVENFRLLGEVIATAPFEFVCTGYTTSY